MRMPTLLSPLLVSARAPFCSTENQQSPEKGRLQPAPPLAHSPLPRVGPQILDCPLASIHCRANCTNNVYFLLSVSLMLWHLGSRTPGERDRPGLTQPFQSPHPTTSV